MEEKPVSSEQATNKCVQQRVLKAIGEKVFQMLACDCEVIIGSLKQKFAESDYKEKLQILTIIPDDWSENRVSTTFGCTRKFVKKGRAPKEH